MEITWDAPLWAYHGEGAWYFLSLPAEYTEPIKATRGPLARGFGSVKVTATIGASTWSTSIFPDKKSGAFLLPVKKDVRIANDIGDSDQVACTVTIIA